MDEKYIQEIYNDFAGRYGAKNILPYKDFVTKVSTDTSFVRQTYDDLSSHYGKDNILGFDDFTQKTRANNPLPAAAQQMPDMDIQPVGTYQKEQPKPFDFKGYLEGQPQPTANMNKPANSGALAKVGKVHKPDVKEAIDNAVIERNKQFGASEPDMNFGRDEITKKIKAGELVADFDGDDKSVLKRKTGFFDSFINSVNKSAIERADNANLANLDTEGKIKYLEAKRVIDAQNDNTKAGGIGLAGEFVGENAHLLAGTTAGAMTGGSLAPGLIGAGHFGGFLAMVKDFATDGGQGLVQKTYYDLRQQGLSDQEAMKQAEKTEAIGAATGLATGAVLSGMPKIKANKAIVEDFITKMMKSSGKLGAVSGAQTGVNDAAEMGVGVHKTAKDVIHDIGESAAHGLAVGVAFEVMLNIHKVTSAIREQATKVVASIPEGMRDEFINNAVLAGELPKEKADEIKSAVSIIRPEEMKVPVGDDTPSIEADKPKEDVVQLASEMKQEENAKAEQILRDQNNDAINKQQSETNPTPINENDLTKEAKQATEEEPIEQETATNLRGNNIEGKAGEEGGVDDIPPTDINRNHLKSIDIDIAIAKQELKDAEDKLAGYKANSTRTSIEGKAGKTFGELNSNRQKEIIKSKRDKVSKLEGIKKSIESYQSSENIKESLKKDLLHIYKMRDAKNAIDYIYDKENADKKETVVYSNEKSPLHGQKYEITETSKSGTITLTPIEGKTKKSIKLSGKDFDRAVKQGFYKPNREQPVERIVATEEQSEIQKPAQQNEPNNTTTTASIDNTLQEEGSQPEVSENKEPVQSDVGEAGRGIGEPPASVLVEGGQPPVEPPIAESDAASKPLDFNKKGILNRLHDSKNIKPEAKAKFESKGLKYETASQDEARYLAKELIGEYGHGDAVALAEAGKFHGDVNSMVFAESLDQLYNLEQKATGADKVKLAEQWADVAIRYDEAARSQGRFISAIADFYKRSPLGVQMAEKANRDEAFREWMKNKEKSYKEVFEEMSKLPEFDALVKEKVENQLKQERAASRLKKRKKIEDFFDNAKFKDDAVYSTIIPPQLINAAIEGMKQATLAGESVAHIVSEAIEHISKGLGSDDWDKEKFGKEWEGKLKQMDGGAVPKGDAVNSLKDRLRNQIKELNRQIEAGKRDKPTEAEQVQYDAETTSLIEERDNLKRLLDEIDPVEKKPLTDEQQIKIATKSIEKSIAEYERRINEKDFEIKKKGQVIDTPELAALRDKRNRLKDTYDAMKAETKKPSEAELEKIAKDKSLDRFRKKLKGLSESQKDEVIRKSFKKLIENGALEYDDFKKIIADTLGYGELTEAEAKKLTELVNDINSVEDLGVAARENRSDTDLKKYSAAKRKAEKSATELGALVYNKPKITDRLLGIMQLNTLGIPSLINNPIFNIWNQATVRFPIGLQLTALDQLLYGATKITNKLWGTGVLLPENNIFKSQGEFLRKGVEGGKQSVEQLFTGLTNRDYFQKEVHTAQIHPFTSLREVWAFMHGRKQLTKGQAADKILQGTIGIPAEIVARALNIGDKPQRYAAEGAQAAVFAKNLGLKDIDYKLFMEFPKEEAYRKFKSQGMTEEAAMTKAEEVRDRIVKQGEESVFQQDNLINDAIAAAFKPFGQAGEIIKRFNMPFIKIPLNAYWSVFNLINPEVALLQSAIYGVKAIKTKSALDVQQAKKWLAHATTGMAMMAVAGAIAKTGAVNPDNEDDATKKERMGERTYEQQNAVNVSKLNAILHGRNPDEVKNGLMVDLKWFGNVGNILQHQAAKLEEMTPEQRAKGSDMVSDLLANLNQSALNFVDKGVFSNSSSLFTAMNKGGEFSNVYLLNLMNMGANTVHPAMFAQVERAMLPYYSKVKADTFYEEVQNNFLARSLFARTLSGKYPPSTINVWGDTMERKDNLPMKLFGISSTNKDNFAQPIYEDYKRTGNTKYLPPSVKPIVNDGKLNTEQARKLEVLVGQARKSMIAPYINDMADLEGFDTRYSKLSEDEKLRALSILYEEGFNQGRDQFIELYPSFTAKEKTDPEREEDYAAKILRKNAKAKQ